MLHSKLGRAALVCAAAVCATSVHAANLLTNGSFEDVTNFVPNIGTHSEELSTGSGALVGWTVTGNGAATWVGPGNGYDTTASQGSYALDLTGLTDSATSLDGVTQTIDTVIGAHYRLTFDLGTDLQYGVPAGILASAGDASFNFLSSLVNPDDTNANIWASETLDFTATSAHTAINLAGSAGTHYVGLDNVSVTLLSGPTAPPAAGGVPEPANWALMILGFGGAGAMLRRRAKPTAACR